MRAELAPLRQRITRAEAEIGRLTRELKELDAALTQPELYADPARVTGLAKARAQAAEGLAAAETDWLAASTDYETAASDS
jgi:ATP-binding cassette, subfamily F, member 3